MSAKKRKKKKSSGQGANFVITLVTLSVIFVFFGYLIGTYAVSVLREQHQASMQLARQDTSVPVVRSETSSAPATSTPPTSPPAQPVEPEAASPPPAPAGDLYRVQVGVFSERANAERMLSMLREAGYEGIIISGPPHRVQTGAFSSQENAAKLRDELIQKGFEAIVVR